MGHTLYGWRAVQISACNLICSMLCHQGLDLLVDYDFVAIFDADFKPEPDFLVR